MNKKEFLDKLRDKISVLNSEEIEDIIGEYSEYIDEKKKKNKKEEDIINELGDVEELATEILKAYKIDSNRVKKEDKFENKLASFFAMIVDTIKAVVKNFSNKTGNEIFKFVCELIVIILIIMALKIPFLLVESLGNGAFRLLASPIDNIVMSIWEFIIAIAYIIVAITSFIYIFKEKYLDKNEINIKEEKPKKEVKSKKGEKPMPEKKENNNKNAFNTLAEVVMSLLKVFIIICIIPFLFTLIGLLIAFIILLLFSVSYPVLICGVIGVLAMMVANVWFLYLIFCFIANKKVHKKFLIITILSSILLFAIATGLTVYETSKMKYLDITENNKYTIKTKEEIVNIKDVDGRIHLDMDETKIVYDNNLKDIMKIKFEYYNQLQNVKTSRSTSLYQCIDEDECNDIDENGIKNATYNNKNELYFNVETYQNPLKIFEHILKDVNNHKIHDYENLYKIKSTIYINEAYKGKIVN